MPAPPEPVLAPARKSLRRCSRRIQALRKQLVMLDADLVESLSFAFLFDFIAPFCQPAD